MWGVDGIRCMYALPMVRWRPVTLGVAGPELTVMESADILRTADILEYARVVRELGITGSGRAGHLSRPRRLRPEGA